jgi:hypothetical protein
MTQKQSNSLTVLTLPEALREAFRAGFSYAVGSHESFQQTHLGEFEATEAIIKGMIQGDKATKKCPTPCSSVMDEHIACSDCPHS